MEHESSSSVLLSQDCFGYSGPFAFVYKLKKIFFSSSVKTPIGILIGLASGN